MAGNEDAALNVKFGADFSDFDKAVDRGKAKVGEFGGAATRAGNTGINSLASSTGVATAVIGRLAAAVTAVGFTAFASKAAESASNVQRGALAASMSLEAYQRLSVALQMSGVKGEAAASGLETFNRVVGLARLKMGELYETLKFIAPELANQISKTKTTEEALSVYAEAIRRVEGDTNKAALATKAFGGAGIDLLPILSKGSAGVADMVESAKSFLTVSEDAAKSSKAMKSEFGLFADALMNDAANKLAPAFATAAKFVKGIRESAETNGGFLEAVTRRWDDVAKASVAATGEAQKYADIVTNLKPLNLIPVNQLKNKPGDWQTTTSPSDAIKLQEKPDFRGADAVQQSIAALAAARGESARAIQLEGAQQIEAARRLLGERVLSEKEFAAIRVNTAAATEAKLVQLRRDGENQLRDLRIAALAAEENGFAVISEEYARDLEKWKLMLDQKLISEKQFQDARASINRIAAQKIAEENSKLGDKIREQTAGYASAIESALGNALNNSFTNPKEAMKTFFLELLHGLQRATMQALILKPIMEGLTGKSTNSGATGDAAGGILGGLSKSLSTMFGGAPITQAAEGGGLRAGVPALINERAGRMGEVFVPEVAGRMVPGERGGAASGGNSSVSNVYNIDARGSEAGVEQRIKAMLVDLERNRPTASATLAAQRRKFPLRAA